MSGIGKLFGVYVVRNPATGRTVFIGSAGAPFEDRFADDVRRAIRCEHSPLTSAVRAILESGLRPDFEVLAVSRSSREIRILKTAMRRRFQA